MVNTVRTGRTTKTARSHKDHTEHKLTAALHRLAVGTALHPKNVAASRQFTVAALSREAGVSRNAIYTNYRTFLDQLAKLVAGADSGVGGGSAAPRDDEQTERLLRLATENAGLLKRAIEAERRAERLEGRCASLLRQRNAAESVSVIATTPAQRR